MATIDEQFIEYIVKQLVNDVDAVKIDRTVDEKGVLLSLTVSPEDIGRVIGKRGATAQSLRNLLRALGSKNDARYNLKIVDIDRPEGERPAPAKAEEVPVEMEEDIAVESTPESGEIVETVEEITPEDGENDDDLAEKTRKELADLDDLDI
jgi:predicted RNA-binding protein YlqC (UPF0109 family)